MLHKIHFIPQANWIDTLIAGLSIQTAMGLKSGGREGPLNMWAYSPMVVHTCRHIRCLQVWAPRIPNGLMNPFKSALHCTYGQRGTCLVSRPGAHLGQGENTLEFLALGAGFEFPAHWLGAGCESLALGAGCESPAHRARRGM